MNEMQSKDLQVGAEYAVKRYGMTEYATVLVVADHEREVVSSARRGGRYPHRRVVTEKMALVRWSSRKNPAYQEEWVRPAQIERLASEDREARAARATRAEALDARAAELKQRLETAGVTYVYPDPRRCTVTLSFSQVARLLDMADEAAKR